MILAICEPSTKKTIRIFRVVHNDMEEMQSAEQKIIEAFSSGRCPLCHLLRQDEFNILCEWVGECGDSDIISEHSKKLLEADGFCNHHFWLFHDMCSAYGSAAIAGRLLEKLEAFFKTFEFAINPKGLKNLVAHFERESDGGGSSCYVCSHLKEKDRSIF